jgi:hypothetical protein
MRRPKPSILPSIPSRRLSARVGEHLDEAIDVREAFFHARSQLGKAFIDLNETRGLSKTFIDLNEALLCACEAIVHLLFETIEALVEIGFLHMRQVYHDALAADARFVTEWAHASASDMQKRVAIDRLRSSFWRFLG